jgi:hypothetical protein
MRTNIALCAALLLASCDESPQASQPAESQLAIKIENQRLRNQLKEAQDRLAASPPDASDGGSAPAPVAATSDLEARTNYWLRLASTSVRPVPFIRRAIAGGVSDPYFKREIPKLAGEILKIRVEGDGLISEWKRGGQRDAAKQIRGIEEIQKLLLEVEGQLREAPALSQDQQAKAKVESLASAGVEGVPDEVMKDIVARAKRTSDDFLLEVTIKNDARDYLKIQEFKASDELPGEVKTKLLARAARRNPEGWSSQWRELSNQAEGYRTMAKWEREGIPGLDKAKGEELIRLAKERYPDDWSMIHYEVSRSADSPSEP